MAQYSVTATQSRSGYITKTGFSYIISPSVNAIHGRNLPLNREQRQFFSFQTSGLLPIDGVIFEVHFEYNSHSTSNTPGYPDVWSSDFYVGKDVFGTGLDSGDWDKGTYVWSEDWPGGAPLSETVNLGDAGNTLISSTGWTDVVIRDGSSWTGSAGSWTGTAWNSSGRFCSLTVLFTTTGLIIPGRGRSVWAP